MLSDAVMEEERMPNHSAVTRDSYSQRAQMLDTSPALIHLKTVRNIITFFFISTIILVTLKSKHQGREQTNPDWIWRTIADVHWLLQKTSQTLSTEEMMVYETTE